MMASLSIACCHSRPCVPCFTKSRPRAASGRRCISYARSFKRAKASLGDASFPFLPKKEDDDSDEDEEEGPSLVPLDPNSTSLLPGDAYGEEGYDAEGLFGPLALLAVGLDREALGALAELLEDDLGARGVVPAFGATQEMLLLDLKSAFDEASSRGEELCVYRVNDEARGSDPSALPAREETPFAPRSSVERPAVVLSGMSSPEVFSVVSAWRDSGRSKRRGGEEEVLFCAAVPANWTNRTLGQLVEDISGDAASVEGR